MADLSGGPSSGRDFKQANIEYYDSVQNAPAAMIDRDEAAKTATLVSKRAGGRIESFQTGLEAGSGNGWLSCRLVASGLVRSAVAMDISGGMLKACRDTAKLNGIDVQQVRGDSQVLPFRDNSFDIVYGGGFLHHLEDEACFFSEAHRALMPGGLLLVFREPQSVGSNIIRGIAAALSFIPSLVLRAFGKKISDILEYEIEKTYSADELRKFADAAGFEHVMTGGHSFLHSLHWYMSAKVKRFPALHSALGAFVPALDAVDQKILEKILPRFMFYEISACFRKKSN